jgi:transcriptional regulator of acetoin/glycerol metabolism
MSEAGSGGARSDTAITDRLLERVHGEFLEMPGLRLTCQQAQRLWGLDGQTCRKLLEYLVDTKFLWRPGHGMYARQTDGPVAGTHRRMAKAALDTPGLANMKEARGLVRGMRTAPLPAASAATPSSTEVRAATSRDNQDDDVRIAAAADVPVLITAESGPERELCARRIHGQSRYGGGPFVALRFHAPASQSESPALSRNKSRTHAWLRQSFDRARGGTLFIDDIVTLSPDTQDQLWSLLGERRCLGSECDVRIVSGASRHVDTDRAWGTFSEPLFYRLNVIHLDLTI